MTSLRPARGHRRRGRRNAGPVDARSPSWPSCCASSSPTRSSRRSASSPASSARVGSASGWSTVVPDRRATGDGAVADRSATSTACSTQLIATTGSGLGGRARRAPGATCSDGRPADEQTFLRRLLVGELRQGALEGVMVEAVAKAAAVPAAAVRRAHMLGGRLGPTATAALTGGPRGAGDGRPRAAATGAADAGQHRHRTSPPR